jgi:lipoic acid synthetase
MEMIKDGDKTVCHSRLPPWFERRPIENKRVRTLKKLLRDSRLHTVCRSAGCPNIHECFARSTATFLILGDVCTRQCRFCGITKGQPAPVDPEEPERIGKAVRTLGIRHAVITSVTRDDLEDGGAEWFAETVRAVRRHAPETSSETLVPDFSGREKSLRTLLDADIQILGHNVETVPRLYETIRPGADFERSIRLLQIVKKKSPETRTKTGLMLGLGERDEEVLAVFGRLSDARCDILTLGQYLRPSIESEPVHRYLEPFRFDEYRRAALETGIRNVWAGPTIRSSYHAEEGMA